MNTFDIESKEEYSPMFSKTDIERFKNPDKPTSEDVDYFKSAIQPRLFQLSNMIMTKRPEKEIFDFLGLTESKFYLYKQWFPELRNAVVQGKQAMIYEMENALVKVGLGMEYEESEIVNVYEPSDEPDPHTGEQKMVLVQKKERITKKVSPPNVRAIEMYLTNKSPENWKRNQPDNITQNNTATVINVSEDQVKSMLERLHGNFLVDTRMKDAEVVDG